MSSPGLLSSFSIQIPSFVDLTLDVTVGRARNAQTYRTRCTVTRQTNDTDIMSQIFTAELCTEANPMSFFQHFFLKFYITEGTSIFVTRSGQLIIIMSRSQLYRQQVLLSRSTANDESDVVRRTKLTGKTSTWYQETKAILNPGTLVPFLVEKMKTLGTAACPPYHIAFVIGGTSAEKNLLTVKLASTHYYDELPTTGNEYGRAFRDVELEKEVLEEAHRIGLGAQFGGKYLAHDIRIIRLPRHGASCPVGLGVSCSADRNIKCKINKEGIWIEKLDSNPGRTHAYPDYRRL